MVNVNIDVILFIQKGSGLPLVVQKLNPRVLEIDPALVSGFLYAIQAFSSEIIEKGSSDFHIDYGKRVFNVLVGKKTMAVAVTSGTESEEITAILRDLQNEFECNWYVDLEIHGVSRTYDEFKWMIMEKLGLRNISPRWVPYPKGDLILGKSSIHLGEYIDGENTIAIITKKCSKPIDEVISEMSRLWIAGDIGFRKTLEEGDIIIPTRKLVRFNQVNTTERSEMEEFAPEMMSQLPRIVQCFDGKTTVEALIRMYSDKIYDTLDFLLNKGAVEILGPEKKRILLAKELLSVSLEVATRVYSKKQTAEILDQALKSVNRPEILSEIQHTPNDWKIDFGFSVYDGLSPSEVMKIHTEWFKFLSWNIQSLPKKKRKKFVEELVLTLREEFFEKYSSDELDGFEEFSFSLESELV